MRRRVYLPTNQLFTSGTHAAAAAASSSRIAGADGGDSDEERVIYAEHDCDVYPQKRAATKNPDKSSDVSRNDTANKPILKRPKPKKPLSGVELNGPLEDDNFDLMSGINDIPHNVSFGISSENRYRDDTEVVTHYSEFTRSDVPPAKDTSLAPSNSKEDEDLFSMTCSSSSMPTSSVKNNNISEPANLKPKTIQDIIRADRPAHWGRPKAPASKRIQASAPSKSSATRTLSQAAHLQAPRSAFPPARSQQSHTAPDGTLLPLSFKPSWLPVTRVVPRADPVKSEEIIDDAVRFVPSDDEADERLAAYADVRAAASPTGVDSSHKASPPTSSFKRKRGKHGPLVSKLHRGAQTARNDEERLASLKRREAASSRTHSDDECDDTLARLQDPRRKAMMWVDVTILAEARDRTYEPFQAYRIAVDAVAPNRVAIDQVLRRTAVYADLLADGEDSAAPSVPKSDEEYVSDASKVLHMAGVDFWKHSGSGKELIAFFDLPTSAAPLAGQLRIYDPAGLDVYGTTAMVCTNLFESI